MLKYDRFVRDVEAFIVEGDRLLSIPGRSHEHPEFRSWRLRAEARVEQAQREYQVSAPFHSWQRSYLGRDNGKSKLAFDQHLSDTLNELRLIVDHYQKDGEPPRRNENKGSSVAPVVQLKPSGATQIVNLRWIIDQADKPSLLKWVFFVFITGFALGVAAANNFSISSGELFAWIIERLPGF
jgi:hypothetical protein